MWICLQKATACESLASSSSSSVLQPTFRPSWSGRDEQLLNPAFNVIRRRCKERHTGVRWLAPLILSTCSLSSSSASSSASYALQFWVLLSTQDPKLLDTSDAAAAALKPAQKSSANKPFLLMKTRDPHRSPWAKRGGFRSLPKLPKGKNHMQATRQEDSKGQASQNPKP
jgi:hypothetical protein